jgi:peptide chain release factor 3
VHLFERVRRALIKRRFDPRPFGPCVKGVLDEPVYSEVVEELAMLDGAGGEFDRGAVLRGETTAVFFGCAANNFGVELLL